jgi:FKBP-type peptidyl-prolyl cis-trans isomerase
MSRIEELEPNIQIISKIKLSPSNEITPQSYQNKSLRSIHEIKSKLLKSLLIVAGSSFNSINNRANAAEDISSTQTLKGFQTKSGLKYFDLVEGTGAEPRYGQLVSFFYTLYYKAKDKEVEKIDSNVDSVPFLHKHGNGRICRGLEEALHTMKVGGTRRAILTKNLGFYFCQNRYNCIIVYWLFKFL